MVGGFDSRGGEKRDAIETFPSLSVDPVIFGSRHQVHSLNIIQLV